jgi:hypothetical protein
MPAGPYMACMSGTREATPGTAAMRCRYLSHPDGKRRAWGGVGLWIKSRIVLQICREMLFRSVGLQLFRGKHPFFDDVGRLPARRRRRERNLYTPCWGNRVAGEPSALPRRQLASNPFNLHEHIRVHLGKLLRKPRFRVADVRVRRRLRGLRGLRPAHAALAPAATGLQPPAPHRVNTSCIRGTPCPLHQHCPLHRNASLCLGWLLRRRRPGCRVSGWPVRHRRRRLRRLRHAPTAATADSWFTPRQGHLLGDVLLRRWRQLRIAHRRAIVAAACGFTASIASKDAAHSWQHLGRHALAALAKVNGPSAAGVTVRTLATAFATAAADAPPLVAPAKFAAAAPRRHLTHACLLCGHWMEGHLSPRREGSMRLPALDGLLCDGWPRRTVGGAV